MFWSKGKESKPIEKTVEDFVENSAKAGEKIGGFLHEHGKAIIKTSLFLGVALLFGFIMFITSLLRSTATKDK